MFEFYPRSLLSVQGVPGCSAVPRAGKRRFQRQFPNSPPQFTVPNINKQISSHSQREATVDAGLGTALLLGHEVLLKCELPSAGKTGGVTYGFLAVPIAYEREVGRGFVVLMCVLS